MDYGVAVDSEDRFGVILVLMGSLADEADFFRSESMMDFNVSRYEGLTPAS